LSSRAWTRSNRGLRNRISGARSPTFGIRLFDHSVTVGDMESASVPFDLDRFVDAQARVYPSVLDELCAGRKRSH
jgi:hypothetical protein